MQPKTVLELANISNIVAVKEASGNLDQIYEILTNCPPNFTLYTGNDEQIMPALMLGASGVISVAANVVPLEICEVTNLYFAGDINTAKILFKKLRPLIDALFIETNPIPVKTAMNLLKFEAGNLRLPLVEMQEKNLVRLKEEMTKLNLI